MSWCKLEVKLDGPKRVAAGCTSRQAPPPLVVAALNLKTSLSKQVGRPPMIADVSPSTLAGMLPLMVADLPLPMLAVKQDCWRVQGLQKLAQKFRQSTAL